MIDVKGLRFSYSGGREPVIKGLDFSINKGEIFGFLGPSGAGKSTTQKIIIGILKNYQGSVKVMNNEVKDMKSDYYEKIGVVFEFPNLYSKFTALENLSYFRSLYSEETEEPMRLLEMVGLEKDARTRVSDFSKGMKMRLNFCRALLNKPELLFLDEPTSGLDPVNAKMVKDIILRKKSEGSTVFLTTHNMNVAEDLCDRVAFIVNGSISLIDSPRRLMIDRGRKSLRVEYREKQEIRLKDFELSGIGYNEEFLELVRNKDIERMHTQEATLEDIFIEVTGRGLA
ncbi:MAG TPA: ABC transporter ATP-binding protein [Bacillota bacterium]|nr:ABC transporter ATP-binding protein [Bacillota bacterium]HRS20934.1 ABC transporter ATP-binding protein [Clostridia bacterium]HQE67052.1 ABC transporter ATP-binding protein [Bacillota bacterium]HQI15459.1 ABC transporter ATP-binding protein [Bacillota bacterium]HQJ36997.1 ABC transporter ATP-binding protein [Bacillota bacterium]